MGTHLLLRWSLEQIQGAQQALQATALALRDVKKDAENTKQVSWSPRCNDLLHLMQALAHKQLRSILKAARLLIWPKNSFARR